MVIRSFKFTLLIFVLFVNIALAGDTVTGKVVSIADGDTITVLDDNKIQHKIRLYGIDCPESSQDFGAKAKKFTSDMVFAKQVSVKIMDTDRYDRSVGLVNVGSISLNEELLKSGYAWHYSQYCKSSFCSQWEILQNAARTRGVGLWSMKNPTPPWEFRRVERGGAPVKQNQVALQSGGVYHGNTKSMAFHQSSCGAYNCKNCTEIFNTREAAIAAGYRPCGTCKP